jgi:CMP-2-keto-3-deoxyoctulosonic acid synthetase
MAEYFANKSKPWRARRKRGDVSYHIGYYATRDEAIEAEQEFDKGWPPAGYGPGGERISA